jgi:methionyl-tRNA formyltransferase
LSARAVDETTEPSQAQILQNELVVGCLEGSLVLEQIQPAGKNVMSGADWFRGLRVEKLELS